MPKPRNHTADPDADLESDSRHAALRANESPRFNSPVRIVFTHYRKRLCDLDNLSTKAVLDALVAANLFADDSPEQVAEIAHRQIKSGEEKTVIHIEAIGACGSPKKDPRLF